MLDLYVKNVIRFIKKKNFQKKDSIYEIFEFFIKSGEIVNYFVNTFKKYYVSICQFIYYVNVIL